MYALSNVEPRQLVFEPSFTARQMMRLFFGAENEHSGTWGNQVPQLHVHHEARFTTDAAWPRPVWGLGQPQPYSEAAAKAMLSQLRSALDEYLISIMNELRFNLYLPRHEALRYYQGLAASVVVRADNGQVIQFPARHLRPFIDANGVRGRFRICFDRNYKLQRLERIG